MAGKPVAPLSAYMQHVQEAMDRTRTTTRCLYCNRSHRGTAKEGREWAERHRKEYHPAMAIPKPRGRRGRRRY